MNGGAIIGSAISTSNAECRRINEFKIMKMRKNDQRKNIRIFFILIHLCLNNEQWVLQVIHQLWNNESIEWISMAFQICTALDSVAVDF